MIFLKRFRCFITNNSIGQLKFGYTNSPLASDYAHYNNYSLVFIYYSSLRKMDIGFGIRMKTHASTFDIEIVVACSFDDNYIIECVDTYFYNNNCYYGSGTTISRDTLLKNNIDFINLANTVNKEIRIVQFINKIH